MGDKGNDQVLEPASPSGNANGVEPEAAGSEDIEILDPASFERLDDEDAPAPEAADTPPRRGSTDHDGDGWNDAEELPDVELPELGDEPDLDLDPLHERFSGLRSRLRSDLLDDLQSTEREFGSALEEMYERLLEARELAGRERALRERFEKEVEARNADTRRRLEETEAELTSLRTALNTAQDHLRERATRDETFRKRLEDRLDERDREVMEIGNELRHTEERLDEVSRLLDAVWKSPPDLEEVKDAM